MIQVLLDRLPLMRWRTALVRAIAAVLTAIAWFAALRLLGETKGFDGVFFAIVYLFPLAWLRPWTHLARWTIQPLVPRFSATPLMAPGITYLRQRDLLCRALGWSAAVSLAMLVMTRLPQPLHARLVGTPLEGGAMVLSLLLAVFVLVAVGGWMHGLPSRWARARLAGQLQGWVVGDALSLGANLLVVLALLAITRPTTRFEIMGTGSDIPLYPATLAAVPAALVWWLCYVLLLHRLARPERVAEPLWLALLPGPAASGDAAAPKDIRTLLAMAHQLAGQWRIGPVSLLIPARVSAGGEHLRAAELAGVRHLLRPTLPVQWSDWQRHLPPPRDWSALPLRELHLPDGLLHAAARELVPAGARLVVLAAPGAEGELAAWQGLLRDRPAALCRTGGQPASPPEPGSVARHEMRAGVLRAAARRLLDPLRPRADQPAVDDPADAPVAAQLEAVALPGLIHPGRFALAAGATLAAVLAVFAWMAFDLKQVSDEAVDAIRSIEPVAAARPPAASAK